MTQSHQDPRPRKALEESEKKASSQPGSYRDKETAEKVVRVDPVDAGDGAIKGIDPKQPRRPH